LRFVHTGNLPHEDEGDKEDTIEGEVEIADCRLPSEKCISMGFVFIVWQLDPTTQQTYEKVQLKMPKGNEHA
jgi:hypothetical protein